MKRSLYEYATQAKSKASRRTFVKAGAAGAGAVATLSGGLSSIAKNAYLQHSDILNSEMPFYKFQEWVLDLTS